MTDTPAAIRARLNLRGRHNPLRCACAWCGIVLREGIEPTSHSICPDCREQVYRDANIAAPMRPRSRERRAS